MTLKVMAAIVSRLTSNFLRRKELYRSVPPNFILNVCRNCHATTTEIEKNNIPEERRLTRRQKRDEGKELHAVYHMQVDGIAAEFLAKRQEEEKHLSHELLKNKELQKLEEKKHGWIIKSIHRQNEVLEQQRKERLEIQKQKDDKKKREEERARRIYKARMRQQRIELVKNMIKESKNWVTPENLEEKIAYCLENETNYNFALSPSGEKHYSTLPPGCIDTEENTPGPAAYNPTALPSQPEYQPEYQPDNQEANLGPAAYNQTGLPSQPDYQEADLGPAAYSPAGLPSQPEYQPEYQEADLGPAAFNPTGLPSQPEPQPEYQEADHV